MEARLLGPVELAQDGVPVPLRGHKEQSLLAVLAIHLGEFVSEEACIDALWPREPPATAARTLQSYVSRLRRTLAADDDLVIESRSAALRLVAAADAVDVLDVERLAAEAERAAAGGDDAAAAAMLRAAEGRWRGRSLGDLADERFAREEAARLEELRLGIVERRVEAELRAGRHGELAAELDALTRLHPLRERLWQARILALYRSGRQADALRAYQTVRELLADELGISPGPELRRLEQAVLEQSPELNWRAPRPTASVSAPAPAVTGVTAGIGPVLPRTLVATSHGPYAGRDDELSTALAAWSEVREGDTSIVLVAGEPGVGKTRFAAELAVRGDGSVLYGRCDEVLVLPYGPFGEPLRAALAILPVEILATIPEARRHVLAGLFPDLVDRLPDTAPAAVPSDADRGLVLDAVVDVLELAAAQQPTMLILDDLHWAAPETLQVLRHLIARAVPRLLLVMEYRDTELTTHRGLDELVADLRRVAGVRRVELRGLAAGDVQELVSQTASETLDAEGQAFAEALREVTDGNPFYLLEILRDLVERGVLEHREDGWNATVDLRELPLPSGVREVIQRRLRALGPDAPEVLGTAALVGAAFPVWLLEELYGDSVLDVVDAGVAARLLVDLPSGQLGFAHALVRQTAEAELGPARRRRLHAQLADALERSPGAGTELTSISHHRSAGAEAGRTAPVVDAALRAAGNALGRLAAPEAVVVLDRADDALRRIGAEDSDHRTEILLGLSRALVRAGDPRRSKEVALDAADLARRTGSPMRLAEAAVAYVGVAWIGQPDEAGDELLQEAVQVSTAAEPALRARLLTALAELRMTSQGRAAEARELITEAVGLARTQDDPLVLANALLVQAITSYGLPDLDARLAIYDECLSLAGDLDRQLHGLALTTRAATRLEAGDLQRFLDDVHTLERAVAHGRWGIVERRTRWLRIALHLMSAEWQEAEAAMHACLAEAGDDLNAINVYAGHTFVLHRETGRIGELLPSFAGIVEANPGLALFGAALARSQIELGHVDEAVRTYERLAAVDPLELPGDQTWVASVTLLAEAAALLGRPDQAARLYEVLRPHRGHLVVVGSTVCLATVDRHLGMLADLLDDSDLAATHLHDALDLEQRLGLRTFVPRTQVWQARVRLATDPGGAIALLEDARRAAAALGMPGVVQECDGLLQRA